jgi:hypothetical protein
MDTLRKTSRRRRADVAALALYALLILSPPIPSAFAEEAPLAREKAELELVKLKRELADAESLTAAVERWFKILSPSAILLAAGGYFFSRLSEDRKLRGELDRATHEKRYASYAELMKAMSPLALYFPPRRGKAFRPLAPKDCEAMGRALSKWYFDGGGLLLSGDARDAYFMFARALSAAGAAPRLLVPQSGGDAPDIHKESFDEFRVALMLKPVTTKTLEAWKFGETGGAAGGTSPDRWRDFILLQTLSSNLRSELSEDLGSRRRLKDGR